MTSQPDIIHILPNISRSKGNQAMKFGQLIEYNNRNNFFKIMQKVRQRDQLQTSFCFLEKLYEVKASGLQLSVNTSIALKLAYKKTSCINLQSIDPEICPILTFQKRLWKYFLHHILCLIFQEKCFSCYILFTDQISLSDCLYFLEYWAICVLQLFVSQAVTS